MYCRLQNAWNWLSETNTVISFAWIKQRLEFSLTLRVQCCLVFFALHGVKCSSVVRAFAHGAMGRRICPSWGGPVELFFDPASALCSTLPYV